MSYLALNTAATGLNALSFNLDVVANNLANVNTVGFKKSRANFEDIYYVQLAQPNLPRDNTTSYPTGLAVGLGVKVSGTQLDMRQGPAEQTGAPLDMMIEGDGFFILDTPDSIGGGVGYTRAGNFTTNADGELVLANSAGYRLAEPNITIPEDATQVTIGQDGTVSVLLTGATEPEEIGQIQLAKFINPAGLMQVGNNVFVQSAASGDPLIGNPTEDGRGSIMQGFLEQSNTEPVTELVSLIRTQRAFEMNSQVIQATNETLQQVNNLRRF
ncbi:MAG: flagellar basal-body rod protein FlgG [Phycisphaerae bacterium]|nr:flagellar basal-body rod protein FlgG [Phycisphaerae bacterium]